ESFNPKIFGADLFRNSKANTFEPSLNIPTPVNYILGSGDKLVINIYGNSLANWNLPVTPEGNINMPGVGILKVAGKTIEQATTDITNRLIANNYAIGRGTNVKVTLGDIRSIRVIVTGQVVRPSTYTISSLSTVMHALFQAGGPSDIGSFRNIEVIRNSRVVKRMDIYDFLVKDSQEGNIGLRDQDIIRVPTYKIRVELKGEVKIPALFEVLPGETINDIINFSGGFTDQAYTARIKVDRVNDQQRRIDDVFENDYKTYIPLRGDRYIVEKILNRYENRITIKGAVFRPDVFELKRGLTLSQLIKNAGGVREDAFMGRGGIIRLNPDNTTSQLSFNVNDVLNKPGSDIVLQREDIVTISSIFDLRNERTVTVNGQVREPGEFAYADSMTVADLIIKAGGFNEGATSNRIQVSRRIYNSNPNLFNSLISDVVTIDIDPTLQSNQGFTLKPFDIVSVYTSPGYAIQKTVILEGEVLFPGPYQIKFKNEKISDIIVRAGGLTASADVEGSSLKRDNAAILGVEKSKVDTAELNKQRTDQLKRLQNNYKEDGKEPDSIYRNNFIGIDLKRILKKPGSNIDLILEDGDVLRIPKQQQIVKVNGEVLYPSAVVYEKGKSFKEYILLAGGFSPKALKRGAYVVYPNGTVKGTRKFLFFNIRPKIKPGSEIYVSKKPVTANNTPQVILGFTTGLASLALIIFSIIKK
ncbi:MAG: capsule biosynthesis protein, partial [Pedobacter sp.]